MLLIAAGIHEMPKFAVVVEVLHVLLEHVRRFDRIAGFECTLDDPAGFEVPDTNTVECLAFAGFHKLIFYDVVGVPVEDNLQTTPEFIGTVTCHQGLRN